MTTGSLTTAERMAQGSRSFTWRGADGTPFPGLVWEPDDMPARKHVLCIHGLSGAAADFGPVGQRLSAEGYAVWAINLRGQGLDPDSTRCGHFLETEGWRADLTTFVESTIGKEPIHLVGESMGALVALDAVVHRALHPQRLVLAVPVTEIRTPVPGWLISTMGMAAKVVPRVKLSPMRFVHHKISIPRLTADDEYMAYLKNIPHRVNGFSLKFLTSFHDLMEETRKNAAHLQVPTLMLSAGHDAFTRPDQSQSFFDSLGAAEKEHVFYPQSHHLLWHDVDTAAVLERISRWFGEVKP